MKKLTIKNRTIIICKKEELEELKTALSGYISDYETLDNEDLALTKEILEELR